MRFSILTAAAFLFSLTACFSYDEFAAAFSVGFRRYKEKNLQVFPKNVWDDATEVSDRMLDKLKSVFSGTKEIEEHHAKLFLRIFSANLLKRVKDPQKKSTMLHELELFAFETDLELHTKWFSE